MLAVTKQCDAIDKVNEAIRDTLQKNLLSFNFSKMYLEKFLKNGELNSGDLFAFYNAEEIKDKYRALKLNPAPSDRSSRGSFPPPLTPRGVPFVAPRGFKQSAMRRV